MDEDGKKEVLKSVRRVYDRQLSELESIDDKAMRTSRTAILILGFVAAGLTAAGPSAVGELTKYPLLFGTIGVCLIFVSAVVSVGVYTVTEYSLEVEPKMVDVSFDTTEEWINSKIERIDSINSNLNTEISNNTSLLDLGQFFLLVGVFSLSTGTGLTIMKRAFGVKPKVLILFTVVAFIFGLIVIRLGTSIMSLASRS